MGARGRYRVSDAGRFYAVRYARHQNDEWPEDGAGRRNDDRRDRRVPRSKCRALAADPADARKLGGGLLRGRALGAATPPPADQGSRCHTRHHAYHLLSLARRLGADASHAWAAWAALPDCNAGIVAACSAPMTLSYGEEE